MSNIKKICCNADTQLMSLYHIFNNANSFGLPAGIALVVDEEDKLIGTITEGDIRRGIIQHESMDLNASQIMQKDPIYFPDNYSISDLLENIPAELEKRNRQSSKYLAKIVLVNDHQQPSKVIEYHQLWEQKVAIHRHIVVVGLGYVGLTMALVMADAGFNITGVEIDESKVAMLKSGVSYIHENGLDVLLKEHIHKKFKATTEVPEDGDVYIISVGTPVDYKDKSIIYDYLEDSCKNIGQKLKKGNLVILRSTVPIGTCRNFVMTRLNQHSGLTCGIDYHLSFAPERTAEGKALKELRTLPQIIGGYNNDSLEATAAIFRDITPTIVRVDSLESAEMAKLINNTFRDYIFAYSNLMSQVAAKFNIDVVNIINAANKGYPRDPVPLPSPGVGGPCLTKDPFIFASLKKELDFNNEIFLNGREINESMHDFVFERVINEMKATGKKLENCNVLVCGLAFKGNPETGDLRNSSSIEIADKFKPLVSKVYGYDFVASDDEIKEYQIEPFNIDNGFDGIDAVLFLNNHKYFEKINVFEMTRSMNEFPVIFDGWNLFRSEDILSAKPSVFIGLSYTKSSIEK